MRGRVPGQLHPSDTGGARLRQLRHPAHRPRGVHRLRRMRRCLPRRRHLPGGQTRHPGQGLHRHQRGLLQDQPGGPLGMGAHRCRLRVVDHLSRGAETACGTSGRAGRNGSLRRVRPAYAARPHRGAGHRHRQTPHSRWARARRRRPGPPGHQGRAPRVRPALPRPARHDADQRDHRGRRRPDHPGRTRGAFRRGVLRGRCQ